MLGATGISGGGENTAGIGGRLPGGIAAGLDVVFDRGNATLLFRIFRGRLGVVWALYENFGGSFQPGSMGAANMYKLQY